MRDVKVKFCFTALGYVAELFIAESSDKEKTCGLPDGNTIIVGAKCFRCPEVLWCSGGLFCARRPWWRAFVVFLLFFDLLY